MTTDPQSAAMLQWLADHPTRIPRTYDPTADLDEATLQRSFGGLSKSARTAQRRPAPIRIDSLGYDQRGRWHAAEDGAA
jgi:hypothetical protein